MRWTTWFSDFNSALRFHHSGSSKNNFALKNHRVIQLLLRYNCTKILMFHVRTSKSELKQNKTALDNSS